MSIRWYWVLLLIILAFAAGYGWHWYNSPLGCPLCLCDKGAMALPQDYAIYWGWIAAAFALFGVALVGELYAIYKQVKAIRDSS